MPSSIAADRFRPLVIQALLLPLLAMLVVAGVLLWQVSRVVSDQWWVEHTDQVIEQTNALHARHLRAESAIRGHLLTQSSSFRSMFDEERNAMEPETTALQQLVKDNPPQVASAEKIREARAQWLVLIDRELVLSDAGGDWMSIVKAGTARAIMQRINDQFETFVKVEQGLRKQRTDRTRTSLRFAIISTLATGTILGLLLAVFSRQQLAFLSQTYGEALQEANATAQLLEQRVADRTQELASANDAMKRSRDVLRITNDRLKISNRELQDFASVASHDLQEPLRKVQAFGDRLKAKSSESLSPESLDYLDRMLNAAGRMKTLINDLLTFARVTSRALPFQPVDVKVVVDQVLSDLESRIEQTGATVAVSPLPVIDADVTQMRQLMQNLISNALKFTNAGQPPRVELSGQINEIGGQPQLEIRVADHGIGFDEKYLDRIFTVFQRLHGRSDFEGTGIGLAVCRRIVERHHGSISAISRPGEGATFIVRLPVHLSSDASIGLESEGDTDPDRELIEAGSA